MTAGLMGVAELACAAAPPQNRVRILRVEHVVDAGAASNRVSGMISSQLPKFADAAEASSRELFSVYWEPTVAAPEGTMVTFEYTQEFSPNIKFLFMKYDWPVEGLEKAFFTVNTGGARPGGRVTAWRARVVYRGRLLAQTQSDTWR
jgi:hypothetical protein